LPLQELASVLGVSMRHLSRTFNATFGMAPKRFVRLARIEKIVAERHNGSSWADIASACGLTDQSHLVREFRDIVGEVPTEFFDQEMRAGIGKMTEANFVVHRAAAKVPS
jgi:AraC-like DNA-binding protein